MEELGLHFAKVREKDGSKTSARYQFQTNFAILKLCELFESNVEQFALLIEQFDDISVIDTSDNCAMEFYQIKYKGSGSWTIDALSKDKNDKPSSSIVSKMYENAFKFPKLTKSISFVSNAPFSAKLQATKKKCDSDSTLILGIHLHEDEIKKIEDSLQTGFPSPRYPNCKSLLRLERTALDISRQDTFAIGALTQVIEKKFGAIFGSPASLYQVLYTDLISKAGVVDQFASTDELIRKKGIRKDEFEKLILKSQGRKRFEAMRGALEGDLKDAGYSSIQIVKIISDCTRFLAARSESRLVETQISAMAETILREDPGIIDLSDTILTAAISLKDKLVSYCPTSDDKTALSASIIAVVENFDV